jgi:Predicted Zn-dependent peptidases
VSDIVLNPVFDQRELEVERNVILQEIGQALDTPDDIIFDWLQEAAYPDQAIGRTILGPAEKVARFGRADLAGFVREHYGPDQMILAAAGRWTMTPSSSRPNGSLASSPRCASPRRNWRHGRGPSGAS